MSQTLIKSALSIAYWTYSTGKYWRQAHWIRMEISHIEKGSTFAETMKLWIYEIQLFMIN